MRLNVAVERGRERAAGERLGQAGRTLEQHVPVRRAARAGAIRSHRAVRRSFRRARRRGLWVCVMPSYRSRASHAPSIGPAESSIVGKRGAFERAQQSAHRAVAGLRGSRRRGQRLAFDRADQSPHDPANAHGRQRALRSARRTSKRILQLVAPIVRGGIAGAASAAGGAVRMSATAAAGARSR